MGKKVSTLRRTLRFLAYGLIVILLCFALSILGLNWYLQSNKTKILDNIPTLNGATLSFNAVTISLWKNFPDVSITFADVLLHDSLYTAHQKPLLQAKKLRAAFSLEHILNDSLELHAIELESGNIHIFTDQNGYNNLNSLSVPESANQDSLQTPNFYLLKDQIKINLQDVHFSFRNALKNKSMVARLNSASIDFEQLEQEIKADLNLDLDIQEIAFNTLKGAYLENSQVTGKTQLTIANNKLIIPLSPFRINGQAFELGTEFYLNKSALSTLYINNQATHFKASAKLLPKTIQEKLTDYHLKGAFSTQTVVTGNFGPGENPRVRIDFRLHSNDAKAWGYSFDGISATGRFVNRLYNKAPPGIDDSKNVRLDFENLALHYGPFAIRSPKITFKGTPEDVRLKSNLFIQGQASAISKWLDHEQFIFDQGHFKLDAQIEGSLDSLNEMLISSHATLQLNDIDVIYKPVDARFPFDWLNLEKKAGDANFSLVSSYLQPLHDLNLDGILKNLPALLIKLANDRTSSEVDLAAKKITWTDFLDYFGNEGLVKKGNEKTSQEKKKTLKSTISGIHNNFQPRIAASVDTLEYLDRIQLTNFSTGLHFENEHTLVLEETKFYYDEGLIDISARLDISDPDQTPFQLNFRTEHLNLKKFLPALNYFDIKLLANLDSLPDDLNLNIQHEGIIEDAKGLLPQYNQGQIIFNDGQAGKIKGRILYEPTNNGLNTQIQLEGAPELINNFYESEDFFFQGGDFEVTFSFDGNIENVDQLLQEAKVMLSIDQTNIFYRPVDVFFPLQKLRVNAHEDQADFDLVFLSDSLQKELRIRGEFDNLHAFLLDDESRTFFVEAEAYSPRFSYLDLVQLSQANKQNDQNAKDAKTLRKSLHALLNTFQPKLTAKIDTFIYSDQFMVQDIYTGIHLLDSNTLVLDKTGFRFHDGTMIMNAKYDISPGTKAPFEVQLQLNEMDIGSLLPSLDYFSIPASARGRAVGRSIILKSFFFWNCRRDARTINPGSIQR